MQERDSNRKRRKYCEMQDLILSLLRTNDECSFILKKDRLEHLPMAGSLTAAVNEESRLPLRSGWGK